MNDAPQAPGPAPGAILARALYQEGVPIHDICARTGLSTAMVYYWADREVGADGAVAFKPQPRRRVSRDPTPPAPRQRRALVNRLWRAAERQVREIETRLATLNADAAPGEAERDARALAVLARVLRELAALEAREAQTKIPPAEEGALKDADTFRAELARRLEALRTGAD